MRNFCCSKLVCELPTAATRAKMRASLIFLTIFPYSVCTIRELQKEKIDYRLFLPRVDRSHMLGNNQRDAPTDQRLWDCC